MKKYISALLLTVFILMLAPAAFADNTTLTTSVPTKHSISLDIGSGGSVNGLRGLNESRACRHSKVVFEIKPDSGYAIKAVLCNGENVTAEVVDGRFVIESLEADVVLKVTFQSLTSPQTGDDSNLLMWSALLLMSSAGMYLLRRKMRE